MSVNRCCPASPPDSISRSPAPSMRSNTVWLNKTLLTRSSGISIPDFAKTPLRKMIRSLVMTKFVVAHLAYRATSQSAAATISTIAIHPTTLPTSPSSTVIDTIPSTIDTDECRHGFGEVPPVRVQVERHRLVVVEELLRIRHVPNSTVAEVSDESSIETLGAGVDTGADRRRAPRRSRRRPAASRDDRVSTRRGDRRCRIGKTRVLTRRVAYRIATGSADPAHTVVLTFTREAAGELRRRLPRLGLTDRITAGTFHAVAQQLLRQRWRRHRPGAEDRSSPIVDGSSARSPGANSSTSWSPRSTSRSARGLGPERVRAASCAAATGVRWSSRTRSRRCWLRTSAEKHRRGVLDLDDLLAHIDPRRCDATRSSRRRCDGGSGTCSSTRPRTSTRSSINSSICSAHGRDDLFLVGDPAQAIYGFNGSDPTLLTDVSDRFPGIEIVRLPVNHRCTPQIVEAGAPRASSRRTTAIDPIRASRRPPWSRRVAPGRGCRGRGGRLGDRPARSRRWCGGQGRRPGAYACHAGPGTCCAARRRDHGAPPDVDGAGSPLTPILTGGVRIRRTEPHAAVGARPARPSATAAMR